MGGGNQRAQRQSSGDRLHGKDEDAQRRRSRKYSHHHKRTMDRPRGPTPGSPTGTRALVPLPGKRTGSPTRTSRVTEDDHPDHQESREAPGEPEIQAFGGLAAQARVVPPAPLEHPTPK